jgi:tRNA (cytidine/uridine-2'-O-)-methyltransferase
VDDASGQRENIGSGAIRPIAPLLHIVLHEPEIPNNTGNIGRTAIATGCGLHLIEPLGFDTSEKACRRAGLDYWPRLSPVRHANFEAYLRDTMVVGADGVTREPRRWVFCSHATRSTHGSGSGLARVRFAPGDHLIFGKETRGLPAEIMTQYEATALSLPLMPGERSLNLATAVCAAVYLALADLIDAGAIELDERGRIVPGACER